MIKNIKRPLTKKTKIYSKGQVLKLIKTTPYEKKQVASIKKWKKEEPSVISQTMGVLMTPLTWFVNKVVPEKAVRGAISIGHTAAKWLTDNKDILRDGQVKKIEELKCKN